MKSISIVIVLVSLLTAGGTAYANDCTTVPEGYLYDSEGNPIDTGYDDWGYNYQARLFNGGYCDAYRDAVWCQPYKDIDLVMKWNDAWLSNTDCNNDGELDRHFGYDSFRGSGAWMTNHQSGKVEVNGKLRKWTYFIKIVAAPVDAIEENGVWYSQDGAEIGRMIWGEFVVVQEVNSDPSQGQHGLLYKAPVGPGLGLR